MIVLIDNYDSFTYNLVQTMSSQGVRVSVFRNDAISVAEVEAMEPDGLVVSPGPGRPCDAGVSKEMIEAFSGKIPLLGVCLGHQCIGEVFGAKIVRAARIMHGKTSMVSHDSSDLYKGLKDPFPAGRYHSLSIEENSLPPELKIDARSDDGEIMGVRHETHQIYGVQFHPESVLTPSGRRLLSNFQKIVYGGV